MLLNIKQRVINDIVNKENITPEEVLDKFIATFSMHLQYQIALEELHNKREPTDHCYYCGKPAEYHIQRTRNMDTTLSVCKHHLWVFSSWVKDGSVD